MLKGKEARLEEHRKSYRSSIRRGKGKDCGDLQKCRERGEGGEAEERIKDGDKEKEIFAFGVELLQIAGTENFLWFSIELCPRPELQERWLILSH